MSEELDKLQSIGAQKIYEATHIPIKYVQSMLHGSFEGFSKVQFIGFISILEREYQEDLSELKTSGLAYFDDKEEENINGGIFVVPQKKKNNNTLYLIIIALIFVLVIILNSSIFTKDTTQMPIVDNVLIDNVQENIQPLVVEINDSNLTLENNETVLADENLTVVEEVVVIEPEEVLVVEPEIVEKSFKIVSKSKVWFGYIDVKTNKHYTRTFKGEKDLDPTKTWLLLFGHGHINIFVNDEVQKFPSRDKVRFLYKDNKLSAITIKEFKKYNKGRKW